MYDCKAIKNSVFSAEDHRRIQQRIDPTQACKETITDNSNSKPKQQNAKMLPARVAQLVYEIQPG